MKSTIFVFLVIILLAPIGTAAAQDAGDEDRWQFGFGLYGWYTDIGADLSAGGETDALLDSEVTAWRLAWKLAQLNQPKSSGLEGGDLVNITVVDDKGNLVRSYITNNYKVYHSQ
jgi:hypothetical protein